MHLISPLASGLADAPNGVARVYRRGTSTRATIYEDFEGSEADSSGADVLLDASGSAIVYVNELVHVQAFDSQGQIKRDFIAGNGAYAVEARSLAFTGTDYTTGVQAAGNPTTAGAIFDLWLASAGAIDWKGLYNGDPTILQFIFGAIYGMFFNIKSPEYGAIGDGATNDAAAIQAAYDAALAAGGGIVVWPPGVYNIGAGISYSTGVSSFAVPGTVTLRQTTADTFCFRIDAALASGPDTPTVIYGIRFDSTVTNSATQILLDPASSDEIHIIACRFGGSAFSTGAGVTLTGTLNWKTVIRDCYFQAQAAVSSVLDSSLVGSGSIVLEGCLFRTPAAAYDAAMVYTESNTLHVAGCQFHFLGTSGNSRAIENNTASKSLQVSGCNFETLSGSSTNYGVRLIANMRVRVDDSNYFTGVTRYLQAASTDVAEGARSYLSMESYSSGVDPAAIADGVRSFMARYATNPSVAQADLGMPKLYVTGQQLSVVLFNDSGATWTAPVAFTDVAGVGTAYDQVAAGVDVPDGYHVSVSFVGVKRDTAPYWMQVGEFSVPFQN